jgi:hypothetical protein
LAIFDNRGSRRTDINAGSIVQIRHSSAQRTHSRRGARRAIGRAVDAARITLCEHATGTGSDTTGPVQVETTGATSAGRGGVDAS